MSFSEGGSIDPVWLIVPDENKSTKIPYLIRLFFSEGYEYDLITESTLIVFRKSENIIIGLDFEIEKEIPVLSELEINLVKIFPLKIFKKLFLIEGHSPAVLYTRRFKERVSMAIKCSMVYRKVDWTSWMTKQNIHPFKILKDYVRPIEKNEYLIFEEKLIND